MTGGLNQSSVKNDSGAAGSPTESPAPSSTSHWNFINAWKVPPQANDRAPAFGVVAPRSESASARRSSVRRKHQEMFKAWSQARHD